MYRTSYTREDADDGAELVVPLEGWTPWTCHVCGTTAHNHDGWAGARCYYCNRPRGSWQCDRCGLINPETRDDCQQCGSAREEV